MTNNNSETNTAAGGLAAFLRSPYTALIFAMFCWGCTTIVVRHVRDDVPPMGLAFWRNVLAFFIILPFVWGALRAQRRQLLEHWKIFMLLSTILWIGGNALLFLSLQYTIAINAGVINSVEPVMIVILATLIFGDRFSPLQAFGVAVSLAGVLILISEGSFERLASLEFNKGDIIVFFAYVFWGFYAVLVRKLPRSFDHKIVVAVLIGLGALCLLPLYLVEALMFRTMAVNALSLSSILFLAIFSSLLAMLFWNYGIARLGAIRAGQFLHLIPVFTVLLAVALLGEQLVGYHYAGIALIAAGLYVTSRP
ncbi:MAG: DMT family transporter [Alphaproteobacteria bacterium]|nr:DMT family transporter [Alphaproteobacteria bacterium]